MAVPFVKTFVVNSVRSVFKTWTPLVYWGLFLSSDSYLFKNLLFVCQSPLMMKTKFNKFKENISTEAQSTCLLIVFLHE